MAIIIDGVTHHTPVRLQGTVPPTTECGLPYDPEGRFKTSELTCEPCRTQARAGYSLGYAHLDAALVLRGEPGRPGTCGHEGTLFRVRDESGVESVSCASCITDELEDQLTVGVSVTWEIERLADDDEEWGEDSAAQLAERGPR